LTPLRRPAAELRKLPYPCRAAVAISNDAKVLIPCTFWRRGLTVLVHEARRARVWLDGAEVRVQANPADDSDRESVSVPLPTWDLPPTPHERYVEV